MCYATKQVREGCALTFKKETMGDSYRDQLALQRRNHSGHKGVAPKAPLTEEQERRSLRSQYFAKKSKGFTKTPAWRRLDA